MLNKNGLFIQMTSLNSPAHLTQILSPDTTDAVPWDGSKFGIVSEKWFKMTSTLKVLVSCSD